MSRSEKDGARDAPRNEKRAEARRMVATRKKKFQRACGIVPRIERDGAERARKDAKEQESATEKRRGNCKIWHRKIAEIIICIQSYNIIGTFI